MKRALHFATLLAVIATACSPAAPAPTGGSTGPVQPAEKLAANQSLSFGQIGMASAMTPEAGLPQLTYYGPMYDFLTMVDEKFNVLPGVAEKWTQPNPTTWRFQIRKGLTFSNGDPLTAADVEFSGRLMIDNKMPAVAQFPNVTEVKMFDADNVDFLLKVPDASVLPAGQQLAIMPKKYYTDQGKAGFASKPIGSGPYELVEFRSADMVSYKKRATEHPFRKVIADKLTFRSITELSQMVAGLRTGDLDGVYGAIAVDQVDQMKNMSMNVLMKQSNMIYGLFSQPENIQRNSPLTDKRVRMAVNYAVDKDAITKTIFKGFATPIGQLSVPDSPSWDDSVKPIPYNVQMAKQLLTEAGYPNGFKMQVGLEYTPFNNDASIPQAIQSNLRDIGIDMQVTGIEFGQFLDKYYGRNGQSKGEIFLVSAGENNGFGTFIYGNLTCNKDLKWWCNPEFDKNMDLANAEPDPAKRGALMRKAAAVMRDDVGMLFLYVPPTFTVLQPKVKGFKWDLRGQLFDGAYRVE